MENKKSLYHQYDKAAEVIKTAILQSQYEVVVMIKISKIYIFKSFGELKYFHTFARR